jgi:hypothetical protein
MTRLEEFKTPKLKLDDPKALVPWGWAPGDYMALPCSTCKQSHMDTDKRSWRCQDCAIIEREKAKIMAEPTTEPSLEDHVRQYVGEACYAYADALNRGPVATRQERRDRAINDGVEAIMREIGSRA